MKYLIIYNSHAIATDAVAENTVIALACENNDISTLKPAAYLENRKGGGAGVGVSHFSQRGRPTVVIAIGGIFRRNFSSLEGA